MRRWDIFIIGIYGNVVLGWVGLVWVGVVLANGGFRGNL
jgi:hypothetical protein